MRLNPYPIVRVSHSTIPGQQDADCDDVRDEEGTKAAEDTLKRDGEGLALCVS